MHMRVIKVILGGAKHVCGREECILHLILGKGCFLGYCNQERLGALSDTCHEVESLSKRAFKLTLEAFHGVHEGECLNREPVILVLDFDVQMLPRDSLPVVRNQEVYSIPSIGSIFAILDRCCQCQEHDAKNAGIFPLINPLDAFYLLNPSGDLNGTQDKLEDFFRERNLEENNCILLNLLVSFCHFGTHHSLHLREFIRPDSISSQTNFQSLHQDFW